MRLMLQMHFNWAGMVVRWSREQGAGSCDEAAGPVALSHLLLPANPTTLRMRAVVCVLTLAKSSRTVPI